MIWPSNEEYLRQFFAKAAQQRVPLSGGLDLTYRCNLSCAHCYAASPAAPASREMTTEQVISILDQITQAGCLDICLTGGEPLLRQDFAQIYSHARRNGLLVTVFTNGALITEQIVELFADLPPYAVEITLYGATAATYEKVTRVKGSYERCIAGIHMLLARHVDVRLKTILMTLNRHEFFAMEKLAKEYGVKFRFDPAIFPRLNGDRSPLELRIPAQEAIALEFSDAERGREWAEFFKDHQGAPASDALYECGAGMGKFHIDPYGRLRPCVMVTHYGYDLVHGDFATGWRDMAAGFRQQKAGGDFACHHCAKRALCGFCPAFFELENGAAQLRSEYVCDLGQYRFQAIDNLLLKEG